MLCHEISPNPVICARFDDALREPYRPVARDDLTEKTSLSRMRSMDAGWRRQAIATL
jgi:hypothetical protein